MSDFREYSAAFHYQNNDLMHYGTKGMRWHHHKRRPGSLEAIQNAHNNMENEDRKKALEEAHDRKILPKVGKLLDVLPKTHGIGFGKMLDSGKTKASVIDRKRLGVSGKQTNSQGRHVITTTMESKNETSSGAATTMDNEKKKSYTTKKRGRYRR